MIPLRPSASKFWTACPAQPQMAAMIPPEPPSDPAREGTCAAWVAEMVLTGERERCIDMIGESHENGWLVEADMAQMIQGYVDNLRRHGGTVTAERRVRLNEMIEGTPDGFAVVSGDMLIVDDLKYGYGIVEPYRNTQVGCYMGAILKDHPHVTRVVIGIYQPRAWHPNGIYRTWEMTRSEADAFVAEIVASGHECQSSDPVARAGEHCDHCPAAATCSALAGEVYRSHDLIAAHRQRHMTAAEACRELKFLAEAEAMLKARKTAVEAEVTARIGNGETFRGWHLQQGVGQRRWKSDLEPKALEAVIGTSITETVMVTPAEAERRGASKEMIAMLSEKPTLTPKLKPVPRNYYQKLFDKASNND